MRRLFMFPCTYTCLNMGDVAMLQFAVAQLRALWPAASIEIITDDATALTRYCGAVKPLPRSDWFSDHYLLGRIHGALPVKASDALVRAKVRVRRRYPALETTAIRLKMMLRGRSRREFNELMDAVESADAVVVSGAGGLTDTFPRFTVEVLRMLEIAIRRGKPTAMFSHGFGPLRNPELVARARAVLPSVSVIGLRERRAGVPLLLELGVEASRMVVTGDDGIEVAFGAGPGRGGDAIGVNVRTGSSAGVDETVIETLRPIVHRFAAAHKASLVSIPIARQFGWDEKNIERLLRGYPLVEAAGEDLDTPAGVARRIGRCRMVVTFAYHAAVFALAQGIPAVGLAKSDYFLNKFLGLADMFGAGCEVVRLDDEDVPGRLESALDVAWNSSDRVREGLREAASAQIRQSHAAYGTFGDVVASQAAVHH